MALPSANSEPAQREVAEVKTVFNCRISNKAIKNKLIKDLYNKRHKVCGIAHGGKGTTPFSVSLKWPHDPKWSTNSVQQFPYVHGILHRTRKNNPQCVWTHHNHRTHRNLKQLPQKAQSHFNKKTGAGSIALDFRIWYKALTVEQHDSSLKKRDANIGTDQTA